MDPDLAAIADRWLTDEGSQPAGPVAALVVCGNIVVRRGLTTLLEASGQVKVLAEAVDGTTALELVVECKPDMVLVDTGLSDQDGMAVAAGMAARTRVLLVAGSADCALVERAVREGCTGYLVHGQFSPAELVDAVLATAAGEPRLSPAAVEALVRCVRTAPPRPPQPPARTGAKQGLSNREAEIMELIVRGLGNGRIARVLFISEKTVKNHINHIYAKLGIRTRAEAIAVWLGLAHE